jgi:hypothetical protein
MPNPNETTDVLIMLYVDTVNIKNATDPSQVEEYVFLSSNHADPSNPTQSPTNPSTEDNFTTDLKSNSQIAWVGAVQNMSATNLNNDSVFITSIVLKTDNIGINQRDNQQGSGNTHRDAVVRNNHGPVGSITNYTNNFRVWNAGN